MVVLALVAQQSATEAPAGFTTPALTQSPAPQTFSNGVAEPPGDTFVADQLQFERVNDPSNGLGPLFNATSCAQCHQNNVTGAASQITELRVGHHDANGNFVNPTVLINDGAASVTGRSIVNDRAICDQAQEHVPDTETIQARRAVLNTLGDGFVEAVADQTLIAIASSQAAQSGGRIHGEMVEVPVLESPGATQIGRFGWKDQQPTLLSFSADAYLNEMGVTSRLVSGGPLNSPWGMVLAPASFGAFGGTLLVGNVGDGAINAFDPASGIFLGAVQDTGAAIHIPGLWGITFGNASRGPRPCPARRYRLRSRVYWRRRQREPRLDWHSPHTVIRTPGFDYNA
jgi:Di-haem oxidoreductase, putative peroxidase